MKNNIIKKLSGQVLLVVFIIAASVGSAFAQNEFEVKYKELPKNVQKYVAKTYAGYNVDKAMQGDDKKGKMSYCDVYISKGTDKHKLIFDRNGEFVKQVKVADATTHAPEKTTHAAHDSTHAATAGHHEAEKPKEHQA